MHFGNPFTYLQDEVDKGKASVFQPTIRENVESFEKWLRGTDFQDVEPKRRQWILDQINSGKLDNVPLVYYTTGARDSEGWHEYDYDTFPNHAHILLKLINERSGYYNTRNDMLNAMFLDADAFAGEVERSPYKKNGDKF